MAGVTKGVALRLPEEMFERVDAARGQVPRERWIREAVELRLSGRTVAQPGPNVENIRSSEQAKRNVVPYQKGGDR